MKIKKIYLPIVSLIVGIFATSCSSPTPQTRIQKNPTLFQSLSPKEQQKAAAGEIDKGMSKSAVFIAWGNPDSRSSGHKNGSNFEHWRYSTSIPVYSNRIYGYNSYGWSHCGRYGRRRGPWGGFGISPAVTYVRRTGAIVEFQNGRVVNWEARNRR